MTPVKELRPFLLHMLWKCIKGFGECCLGVLALFWIAGWMIIAPAQFVAMFIDNEIPLWALILGEVFWLVPAAFFIWSYLYEQWENYLISKGYTKS